MTALVAGHTFVDTPRGEACSCGKRWIEDVLSQRERWRPGELGIAHSDGGTIGLNDVEIASLHAKLDRIWGAVVS